MNFIMLFAAAILACALASNCVHSEGYKLQMKANVTDWYCDGGLCSMADDTKNCGCGDCCDFAKGTCVYLAMVERPRTAPFCTAGSGFDHTKKKGVAATSVNFQANCCTKYTLCTSIICPSSMILFQNKLFFGAATEAACCRHGTTTCSGVSTSCSAGTRDDTSKAAFVFSVYQTDCCLPKPLCTSVTCPAGTKNKVGYDTRTCSGASCDVGTCCDLSADTTCQFFGRRRSQSIVELQCNRSTYIAESSKDIAVTGFGITPAGIANAVAKCCSTNKATCAAFKDASAATLSALSPKGGLVGASQQAQTTSVLIGFIIVTSGWSLTA